MLMLKNVYDYIIWHPQVLQYPNKIKYHIHGYTLKTLVPKILLWVFLKGTIQQNHSTQIIEWYDRIKILKQ